MPIKTDKVEFGARVPPEEYERFRERFPQQGAVAWFINTSLREFNDAVEKDPSSVEYINQAVHQMMEVSRLIAAASAGQRASEE